MVDCVDAWAHELKDATPLGGDIEVNLSDISDGSFRFFEMHRFSFVQKASAR